MSRSNTSRKRKPRLPSYISAPANDNYPPQGQSAADEAVPATPTPERLAMAGEHVVQVAGTVRLVDRAIDRLHAACQLDPDAKRNNVLHAAAEQYLGDYYAAGLAPLGAFDYARPMVDGSSPKTDSDYRSGARERWNRARAAMGKHAAMVDRVVLHNGPGDILELRNGLADLARRYNLLR